MSINIFLRYTVPYNNYKMQLKLIDLCSLWRLQITALRGRARFQGTNNGIYIKNANS